MQDRYAADIGDYVKVALLRTLGPNHRLGVAWYLYPDENHNSDGRHITYLSDSTRWRALDPELFDALQAIAQTKRSVAALERCGVLDAKFHSEPVPGSNVAASCRSSLRQSWFRTVLQALSSCDLVFADPDNGLVDDEPKRRGQKTFGKQMPLSEAQQLAADRPTIIYHHNTRFAGGHDLEVEHWKRRLGPATIALRANAFSCRTFFLLNPTPVIRARARIFAEKWRSHGVKLDA